MSQKTPSDKRAAKKAVVLNAGKKNRTPLFIALAGLVLAAGAVFYYLSASGHRTTLSASLSSPKPAGSLVSFPAATFGDGKARHFEHRDGDTTVRYFVLKSTDGVIRAAFDACDVCWPAGRGYVQEGDRMICRNCGQRFSSDRVNEVQGGCNPAPLARKMENGQVVIRIADILEGKRYFNFSGKA